MPTQRCENFSNPENIYIGIDVHLKQWNVCIIQGGIKRKPFQQEPNALCLMRHLHRHYPGHKYYSAYEAGVCGCSVHYELTALGINNIIFNAADVSQTNKEKARKTDAVDAAKIARSLANGELQCIHIPPQWRLYDRNLLRLRNTMIADQKRHKSRLRHFLHVNGIEVPADYGRRWTLKFIQWLKDTAAELDDSTGRALELMIADIEYDRDQLRAVERELLQLMATDRYKDDFALLRSVPGVGIITAFTLLLECGDLSDFRSAEAFCAFVGLIPDSDKSDEHDGKCGITRRRHRVLRYMLTECAWRAVKKDEHLSSLFASYSVKMHQTKAIVKIANKLAKRIKFVLKNKQPYVTGE